MSIHPVHILPVIWIFWMEEWRLCHYQDGNSVTSLTAASSYIYPRQKKDSEVCQTVDGANPDRVQKSPSQLQFRINDNLMLKLCEGMTSKCIVYHLKSCCGFNIRNYDTHISCRVFSEKLKVSQFESHCSVIKMNKFKQISLNTTISVFCLFHIYIFHQTTSPFFLFFRYKKMYIHSPYVRTRT